MTNRDIAERLEEIADILEIQGGEPFRVRSYRRAAESISHAPFQITVTTQPGALTALDGIGGSIAERVMQIARTGTCDVREELLEVFPEGLLDVLRVPGVGPKKAALFFREAHVHDLSTLEQAARDGRLAGLKGMGKKSEERILEGLEALRSLSGRILLGEAWERAEELVRDLGGPERVRMCGSLRRGRETIGDLDLLTSTENAGAGVALTAHSRVESVPLAGETKSTVIITGGIQVDLRVVPPESLGAAWMYFTGSKQHNVRMRELAQDKGWKLNEYGLFDADGQVIASDSEESIYSALGLPWIPPELREDAGEFRAARDGSLPTLIEAGDIRGDTHCHSTWSDGVHTIEEMARGAQALGMEYMVISDHSKALGIAGGINEEQILQQAEEVDQVNEALQGFRVLKGIEVDVLSSGELDISVEVLAQLDWVNASIHSGLSQSAAQVTERSVRAALSPHVDVVCHPLGRLLGRRKAMEIDFEALLQACEEGHTALEINCSPDRLDLPDTYARQAAARGIPIIIATDAHAIEHRGNLRYGVAVARRAWLTRDQVLNCRPLEAFLQWTGRGSAPLSER